MDDFEDTFDFVCERAPMLFKKDGFHTNMLFFGMNGKRGAWPLIYDSEQEKEALYILLEYSIKGCADWYIQIAEAWVISGHLDDALGALRPSLNQKRDEALMIFGRHIDGRILSRYWKIVRPLGAGVYLEPWTESPKRVWSLLDKIMLGIDQPAPMRVDDNNRLRIND
jgi:hypothetical protein